MCIPCITFVTRAVDVDVDMFPEVLNVSLSVALSQTVGHHPGDSGLALAGVTINIYQEQSEWGVQSTDTLTPLNITLHDDSPDVVLTSWHHKVSLGK